MEKTAIINQLLFEYDALSEEDVKGLVSQLPRKIVRWLGANHPDNRMRKVFFRETGVQIGEGAVLNPNLIISDSYKKLVRIGARVSIGPGVMIIAEAAPNNSLIQNLPYVREHLITSQEVVIEDDAWIGAGVIILPGVTIGRMSIVGAGSVVTKNAPPCTIVAGVPGRVIKDFPKQ